MSEGGRIGFDSAEAGRTLSRLAGDVLDQKRQGILAEGVRIHERVVLICSLLVRGWRRGSGSAPGPWSIKDPGNKLLIVLRYDAGGYTAGRHAPRIQYLAGL